MRLESIKLKEEVGPPSWQTGDTAEETFKGFREMMTDVVLVYWIEDGIRRIIHR